MTSSLNKVELIGRLGKDPEIKNLSNGSSVANFSVATSETWKDKRSGERQEKTEWHNIVVWNENTIKFAESYLKKGDLVRIEGKIQTRSWEDNDGNKKYATEVVIPAFASIDALMKLSFDNDNRGGGDRDDDRGSSRGSSRGNSRDRDDDRGDSRSSGRSNSRSRDDDRGDDRGGSRGGGRGRDDRDDDRRDPPRRAAASGSRNNDMDDDIPF
ncbi:single-stranded DNA-binding protein [Bradyrhizobium sp. th.b2]|uniref:single-stranded DNA-binding protein n=1 Tax=Bradyrhizobium sp. th-b2 TaxID=172088 RepID=UPI0004014E78|nr:single-stranded DNA-binding protein [Bradyrhizobium sp. th.b2]